VSTSTQKCKIQSSLDKKKIRGLQKAQMSVGDKQSGRDLSLSWVGNELGRKMKYLGPFERGGFGVG